MGKISTNILLGSRADLVATCVDEIITRPPATQGFGALLTAHHGEAGLAVRHASANLADFIGVAADDALGRDLVTLVGAPPDGLREDGPPMITSFTQGGRLLAISWHVQNGLILAEIEAAHSGKPLPAPGAIVVRLRAARSKGELFAAAAECLREITGFDRVITYKFAPDQHGSVIAENCAPGLVPMLGLHFPALDIPPQARAMLQQALVRLIADAHAPSHVLRHVGPVAEAAPDQCRASLRKPSDCHLQYLRNMGSHATLTVALNVEGRLWGILACHNSKAAHVAPEARALCELIGQVSALMVITLRDEAARAADMHRVEQLSAMGRKLAACDDDPASLALALKDKGEALLTLCHATGAIIRLGGRMTKTGITPLGEAASALLDTLLALRGDDDQPFAHDSLSTLLGTGTPAGAAGVLVLPLAFSPGDAIVWLRPEQAQFVNWGGDPDNAMEFDVARGKLMPRTSFACWLQEVRGRCSPWLAPEIDAAYALRRVINQSLIRYAETMRVARDAADRATRAKSEFLATMSHEIRSPMSGLLGVLELLRATGLDDDQSRMASMIHNSATMLLAVLNDVLDFSKIEAGALSINHAPVALRDLIADLVHPHRAAAAHKGVAVCFSIDNDVPNHISTDPLRLRQIVGNLLSNAVKFTGCGEVVLSIGTQHSSAGPLLCCRVRDTGIGIAPDVLPRLFAPFMQADGSTTRNFGGTGLGLCISRQLALLLDGNLTVQSERGEGSEFTLTVPLFPCEDIQPDAPTAQQAVQVMTGGHVLVVDDDTTIRWLSNKQLEKLGLTVDVAENGEAALQKLQECRYDLMLTDCHMPRMDGVTLTRIVRAAEHAHLRAMPIIGLTADVTEHQRLRCEQAGMSELAIKPLTIDRLSQILRRHLAGEVAATAADEQGLRAVPFDDSIYLSIFEPGDQEGAEWLRESLANTASDCDALQACLSAASGSIDRTTLRLTAHRLAGTAFSAGLMHLGAAARALETAAADGEVGALRELDRALRHAYAEGEAAIDVFVKV